jgi:hypothetical protein
MRNEEWPYHVSFIGFFSGERFSNTTDPADVADEIALNPVHFATHNPSEILSTLAHEMTHLWQHHYGRRPRKSYHDRQWAAKMREIGLIPTDTGAIGGKETGQKVSHVIATDGKFAKAAAALLKDHPAILYHDRSSDDAVRKKKAASKTKYTCPGCGLNAWAKPAAPLVCGECKEPMHAEQTA